MSATFPGAFADARPVAQHCAELTWRGPRPEERAEHVAAWCRDLAGDLAQDLGQLFTGGKLHVTLAEPDMLTGREVFERIGAVGVNCLLRCGEGDQTVLLSLDYSTAVALTDSSFGGEGEPPSPVPSQLPRSAALLVEQFATMIARTIATSNGSAERIGGDVLARSESVRRLKPFSEEAEVALFRLTLAMGAFAEWNALIAVAADRLTDLLPGMSAKPARRRNFVSLGEAAGTFAQMPMPLEAVLGEFELSLGALERLKPGDEILLSIPAELPLRMGDQLLAHGALGTIEDRMALRLTKVPGKARPANRPPDQPTPQPSPQPESQPENERDAA